METTKLIEKVMEANFHKGGIRCLKLFRLNDDFFARLKKEINDISLQFTPSDVCNTEHVSNPVTKPYGQNYHYSLYNQSGKSDDYTMDWNRSNKGKRFHFADQFPEMNKLTQFFEGRTNMKLLVLGPNSGLYPHEAHLIGTGSEKKIILRFHLPVFSNNKCEMLLDNEYFRFEEQYVYFFNEGCIHSAYNHGDTPRLHLSWDMPLTEKMNSLMFAELAFTNDMLSRVETQIVQPIRHKKTKNYELQGESKFVYDKLRLRIFKISKLQFNYFYNNFLYLKYKLKKIPKFLI
jgi:hypothetical protein